MENAQPIFDSAAGPGRYGVAAMFRHFGDQSGIARLVRRLHGLGMTILRLQIFQMDGKPLKAKNNSKRNIINRTNVLARGRRGSNEKNKEISYVE
jgi:hypothetical protein